MYIALADWLKKSSESEILITTTWRVSVKDLKFTLKNTSELTYIIE